MFGRPSTSTTEDDGRTSSPDLLASDHHSRNTFNLQWEHSKRVSYILATYLYFFVIFWLFLFNSLSDEHVIANLLTHSKIK